MCHLLDIITENQLVRVEFCGDEVLELVIALAYARYITKHSCNCVVGGRIVKYSIYLGLCISEAK